MKRECRTCDYWDMHSLDMVKGDCRAPDNHRYSHVPFTSPIDGKRRLAMMDSFGREETKPNFVCGRWKNTDEVSP